MFQDDVQLAKSSTNISSEIMPDVICQNSISHQRAIISPCRSHRFEHSCSMTGPSFLSNGAIVLLHSISQRRHCASRLCCLGVQILRAGEVWHLRCDVGLLGSTSIGRITRPLT